MVSGSVGGLTNGHNADVTLHPPWSILTAPCDNLGGSDTQGGYSIHPACPWHMYQVLWSGELFMCLMVKFGSQGGPTGPGPSAAQRPDGPAQLADRRPSPAGRADPAQASAQTNALSNGFTSEPAFSTQLLKP